MENTITISAVGYCGYVHFHRVKFWINDCGFKLLNIDKNINVLFLFHCLKNKEKEMMNLKRGTYIPYISRNDLYKFRVKLSPSLQEQNKIADFLYLMDEKIKLEKELLNNYELQKKYFLKNLFV